MATTTNYGWTTPDDTALVKDGAAAIRTLGSSVDTTTKNLNPETTLGDIAYRSSTANVKTRLGLGTANQVLAVNSGATAPEWKTISSGGMTLINSGGTALSGSSVTISSIPTTYVNLFVSWVNVTGSAIADFRIRFNGITTANSHMQARVRNRDGVLTGGLGNDDSFATLGFICATSAFMSSGRGNLIINNASITQIQSMPYIHYASDDDAAAGRACFQGTVGFTPAAAITSVTFLPSGGTFSTGTVYVYGVN